jgi:hypothetical protein
MSCSLAKSRVRIVIGIIDMYHPKIARIQIAHGRVANLVIVTMVRETVAWKPCDTLKIVTIVKIVTMVREIGSRQDAKSLPLSLCALRIIKTALSGVSAIL